MSIAGLRYALTVPKLTSSERLLFIIIADAVKGEVCWPSQGWLAKRSGLCVRTVRTSLEGLETKGHIVRDKRILDGKRTTDMIRANLPESRPKQAAKSAGRKLQKVPSNPTSPYGVGISDSKGPAEMGILIEFPTRKDGAA